MNYYYDEEIIGLICIIIYGELWLFLGVIVLWIQLCDVIVIVYIMLRCVVDKWGLVLNVKLYVIYG